MMYKREIVSSWQMAALFLAFLTGSAIVNIPAPLTAATKNAAWVSLWLANGLGMLLLFCVLYLYRKHPELTFVEYSERLLGSISAIIVAFPFVLMVLLMLTLIVVDIGGFFKSTMMRETPSYIFHTLILFTAALTVRAGIEVMARMFVLLLLMLFFFTMAVLVLTLPSYRPELLMPVFQHGFKQVTFGVYQAWGFPYAELVVFSMLLPYTRKNRPTLVKLMYGAMLINGISLSLVIICTIMALGPLSSSIKFSLFVLARLINVAEIIERIESVIGMVLITASYMKATLVMYILNSMLTQLFRLQEKTILIYPIGLVTLLLTLTLFQSELEFAEFVSTEWPLFMTVFGVFPVLGITLVAALKNVQNKDKTDP